MSNKNTNHSGKGDKWRLTDYKKFRTNFDSISSASSQPKATKIEHLKYGHTRYIY